MPPEYRAKQAEVLSVRFPKEYDHTDLAAKHPKLCSDFTQNSVYLWFFNPYIHKYGGHDEIRAPFLNVKAAFSIVFVVYVF